jgi:hypothetical protein
MTQGGGREESGYGQEVMGDHLKKVGGGRVKGGSQDGEGSPRR